MPDWWLVLKWLPLPPCAQIVKQGLVKSKEKVSQMISVFLHISIFSYCFTLTLKTPLLSFSGRPIFVKVSGWCHQGAVEFRWQIPFLWLLRLTMDTGCAITGIFNGTAILFTHDHLHFLYITFNFLNAFLFLFLFTYLVLFLCFLCLKLSKTVLKVCLHFAFMLHQRDWRTRLFVILEWYNDNKLNLTEFNWI